ncbi:MAG: hypothetical protein ACFFDN_32065 [Candidatus Hodarchaeota archaeon]
MDLEKTVKKIFLIKRVLIDFSRKISNNNPWIYLILAISFLLNIWGLNWGIYYHPDELKDRFYRLMWISDLTELNPTIAYASTHPTSSWAYPTFHIYVLTIINLFYFYLSRLIDVIVGFMKEKLNLDLFYVLSRDILSSWENIIWLSRFITSLMGVLGVFLIFQICQEVASEKNKKLLPLVGAFVLATANIWVNNSHFATVDLPMAFWLVMATFFFV